MLSPTEVGYDLAAYGRAWLAERVAVVLTHADAVSVETRPAAVHALRVACRRLREALTFFASAEVADQDALAAVGRDCRRLARSLRRLRELDVAARTLADLEDGPLDADIEATRNRLLAKLGARRDRKSRQRAPRIAARVERLRASAARLGLRARPAPAPASDGARAEAEEHFTRVVRERLAERRDGVVRLVRALPRRRAAGPDATQLHDVRVALKHWRYAAELARPLGKPHGTSTAALRRLQELGGRSQDLTDLALLVEDAARRAPRKRRSGLDALLQRVIAAREEAAAAFVASLHDAFEPGGGRAATDIADASPLTH